MDNAAIPSSETDPTTKPATDDENVEEKNIIFYWFRDDELGSIDSLRIFIPQPGKFIPLNFDPIGEVYESEPHSVPLGSHIGHLQCISATEQSGEQVTVITSQHQLILFEVTKSRGRIIVKIDPDVKAVDMTANGITLAPEIGEVKWDRNAGSSSPEHQQYDYNSDTHVNTGGESAATPSATPRHIPHHQPASIHSNTTSQPISIEEMLKKYQLDDFGPNATDTGRKPDNLDVFHHDDFRVNGHNGVEANVYHAGFEQNGGTTHVKDSYKDERIAMLEETITNLQNLNERKSDEIVELKTKVLESDRIMKQKDEALNKKQDNEVDSLRRENERLAQEVNRLKKECDVALVTANRNRAEPTGGGSSSLAIAKRCEYLESELREVRQRLKETSDDLNVKRKHVEDLQIENERLKASSTFTGSPVKLQAVQTSRENGKVQKSVDFVMESSRTSGSTNESPRSVRNEITGHDLFPQLSALKPTLDHQYSSLEQQDNYTSNNLKFLRDRLSELRSRNEDLQKRYCQTESAADPKAIQDIYGPSAQNNNYGQVSTVVPTADSNSTLDKYQREKRRALVELEELREHLACVKSEVKQREGNTEKPSRNEAIEKLKKPSEMFHTLSDKYQPNPPPAPYKSSYITEAIIERRTPVNESRASEYKPSVGMESDSTEVLLNAGTSASANFPQSPPIDPRVTTNSNSSSNKKRKNAKHRSRSTPPRNRYQRECGKDESSTDSSDTYRGFEGDKENETRERYDPEKLRTAAYESTYRDSYFNEKPKYEHLDSNTRSIRASEMTRIEDPMDNYSSPYLPSSRVEEERGYSRAAPASSDYTNGHVAEYSHRSRAYDKGSDNFDRAEYGRGLSSAASRDYRSESPERKYDYPPQASLEERITEKYRERMDASSKIIYRPPGPGKPYVPRSSSDIKVGDRIKFSRSGGKISQGVIKYVGSLPARSDYYVGVELENGEGKHDGTFQGRRYFTCKTNKGVFVSFKKIVMCYTS